MFYKCELLNDSDLFRSLYPALDMPIGLLLMTDLDVAVRGREGAFHPLQVTQVWGDADGATTGFYHLYAQDKLAQPRGWSGGPAVAKTVTEALVAIGSIVAMNVFLTGRYQLVDTSRIG